MAKQSNASVHAVSEPATSVKSTWINHGIVLAIFLIIASLFCMPALQGRKLLPHDIEQWAAMSQEERSYYETHGENAFWTNRAFGGMPTGLIDFQSEGNWLGKISNTILLRNHGEMDSPIMLFFWSMVSFYILAMALRIKPWIGGIGAVAFAFSTYHPIIINAGHVTKMIDLAFFPGVIAGVLYAYKGKYWKGAAITAVFLAIMINAGHYQIIYYAAMSILLLIIFEFVHALKHQQLKQFFIASAILAAVAGIALGTSSTRLLLMQDVTDYTTRGTHKELKDDQGTNAGLDKEYAFRWSNGIGETFGIMAPDIYGGGTMRKASDDNVLADKLSSMGVPKPSIDQVMPAITYWGPQQSDGLGGSIYFGAVICFLFIIGMVIIQHKLKWWALIVAAFFIMVSWGKHFEGINYMLFDTLPMFNKFRSPNMAMSIAGIIFPLIAVWAVHDILSNKMSKETLLAKLKLGIIIGGAVAVLILLTTYMFLDYTSGAADQQLLNSIFGQNGSSIMSTLMEYRKSIATGAAWRTIFFVAATAAILWMYAKEKLSAQIVVIGLAVLVIIDLLPIAKKYLPEHVYLDEYAYEQKMAPRPVDKEILKDKSYYRVADFSKSMFNDAFPSLFHNSVGGYHPAKLQIYQDLITHHIGNLNVSVFNMLNTKYFINAQQDGKLMAMPNPGALGNAWFVPQVRTVQTAQEEMDALAAPSLRNPADSTAGSFNPATTAIIRQSEMSKLGNVTLQYDSTAKIELTSYSPRKLTYNVRNAQAGLAVFSEIYYPKNWVARIDGKEQEIIRVNYVLRGLMIPAGAKTIEMEFTDPASYSQGETYALVSSILVVLIVGGALYFGFKSRK